MKQKNTKRRIIFIAIIAILTQIVMAAAELPVEVKIDPADKLVEKGESFTINISFDPNGTAIAGAQFNLRFNQLKLNVVNVTEGDLFNKKINSFFNEGVISNSAGTLINGFSAIIGRHNTTEKGNITMVTMIAMENSTDFLNLSNVKIANPYAEAVAYNLTAGQIRISPRSDVNGNFQKGDIQDLTTIRRNLNKPASFCPRCDVKTPYDGLITTADYNQAVAEKGAVITV